MTGPSAPGDEFEWVTLPRVSGQHGRAGVTLLDAPFLRCARTGAVRALDVLEELEEDDYAGDFPLFVFVAVMFGCGAYTMKLKEYLPRILYHCRACRKELPAGATEAYVFTVEAGHSKVPRFRVRLTAPGVACPGCGEWNLIITAEIERDILGAVADALRALPRGSE